MRDLDEIKRINSAEGVGEKLGPLNGQPVLPRYTYQKISKGPSDEPDPIDHYEPIVTVGKYERAA
jgi:hypothetical protein